MTTLADVARLANVSKMTVSACHQPSRTSYTRAADARNSCDGRIKL